MSFMEGGKQKQIKLKDQICKNWVWEIETTNLVFRPLLSVQAPTQKGDLKEAKSLPTHHSNHEIIHIQIPIFPLL